MQSNYYQEGVKKTRNFRYKSDEVTYHVFKDDDKNPHPEDLGARPEGKIFISDNIPEPLRDIVAYHEWIEVQGIKKHNYPREGTPEGNRIIGKLHTQAIKKEKELASYRKVLEQYEKWLLDLERIFGPRG